MSGEDDRTRTQSLSGVAPAGLASPMPLPARIGRYRVERILGEGGFGRVFLAHDDELARDVAIKVPHPHRALNPDHVEAYLAEARVVAGLDHSGIVPVFDVGRSDDGACYIVSKLIEGTDLSTRVESQRPRTGEIVEWIATVAEALHYAHRRGLVHRDIKPSNLLIDRAGRPYLTDFGLALRDADPRGPRVVAGTPAYMSPEQARGEGHRVDGRSDIFSLGVVLYELLTGTRPFRGTSATEIMEEIVSVDARPPRQLDDSIPRELERICLKALSRRSAERYTTAKDMADDIREFQRSEATTVGSSRSGATIGSRELERPTERAEPMLTPRVSAPATPTAVSAITPSGIARVVPKGLRAFDAADADFFLELLSGPRDRDGLPEGLRFWKTRIESSDAEETFAVGLVYGPSGCGKSSLIRAGLLPRLPDRIVPLYVESTADETEQRLLKRLRSRLPELPTDAGLADALAMVRRGQGLAPGKKALIVLDQFEQWLHAQRDEERAELVRALRQCDGGRLQCLLLVRDDFWLAVSRFMRALEVRLVEGQNSALVDLFDRRHAIKVLTAFGRAFGALPDDADSLSRDQKAFVEQAVAGLAQDGKVIPVRLALFAEMIKSRPWTLATLKAVGGAEGVGVAFLEETFASPTAHPEHRLFQKPARAVLQALLPEQGTNIRGHMRSEIELAAASGLSKDGDEFAELVRILDGELRLITPAEKEEGGGRKEESEAATLSDSSFILHPSSLRFFQLTHDYLVPSLRTWLSLKQRETRRGRAELLLAERTEAWIANPQPRHLPSLWEWLGLVGLTRSANRTPSQRSMLAAANRRHGLRAAGWIGLIAVAIGLGLFARRQFIEGRHSQQATALVQRLIDAESTQVPSIVQEFEGQRTWTDPLLRARLEDSAPGSRERLHASLALLPVDPQQEVYLVDQLLEANPTRMPVIRDALASRKRSVEPRLWEVLGDGEARPDRWLRAACALATYAPADDRWDSLAGKVADRLVAENPAELPQWIDMLRPARLKLIPDLKAICIDAGRKESERVQSQDVLADFAADQPAVWTELLVEGDDQQFARILPKVEAYGELAPPLLEQELSRGPEVRWRDPPLDSAWTNPDAAAVARIEAGGGLVAERFAICQTMPLDEFLAACSSLRISGYRPERFRPFPDGDTRRVAAIWARDGRDWALAHDLTAEEGLTRDASERERGLLPADVTGYSVAGEGGTTVDRFAVLWVERESEPDDVGLYFALGTAAHERAFEPLRSQGFSPTAYGMILAHDGATDHHYFAIWRKFTPGVSYQFVYGAENVLAVSSHADHVVADQFLTHVAPLEPTAARYARQLADAEAALDINPVDENALYQAAESHYWLNQDEQALAGFDKYLERQGHPVNSLKYRALILARLGRAEDARAALSQANAHETEEAFRSSLAAAVELHLGDLDEALRQNEVMAGLAGNLPLPRYEAARLLSLATGLAAARGDPKAGDYANRAMTELTLAIELGFADIDRLIADPALDPLLDHPRFAALAANGRLRRRYSAVYLFDPETLPVKVLGLDPTGHLAEIERLAAADQRPTAIHLANGESGLVGTSAWRGPAVTPHVRARFAARQSNAAAALARLGRPDQVWPVLQASPDPTTRSRLIHRFAEAGVDYRLLVARLDRERDVSIQRALLQSLGEFGPDRLPQPARDELVPRLAEIVRATSDPGLRASAEWLMRTWGQVQTLDEIAGELAGRPPKAGINWYVTRERQTMVVLAGPAEFEMGSPDAEPGRSPTERRQRRRIPRTIAIGAKEVTVGEFARFEAGGPNVRRPVIEIMNTMRSAATALSPRTGLTWYEAAAYCNWLCRTEGIPEDQWCYLPNDRGAYDDGMRLAPDSLARTGYRLPTSAEWEFACRGGTTTSRYFGESSDRLAEYASEGLNLYVSIGLLKPNDFGLFDILGGAAEWCHDPDTESDAEPAADVSGAIVDDLSGVSLIVNDEELRVVRGAPFVTDDSAIRAAYAISSRPSGLPIELVLMQHGFRLARTMP